MKKRKLILTKEDEVRVFQLRRECKMGIKIPKKDLEFLERVANEYPDWYSSLDQLVFDSTKPFGTN